MLYQLLWNMFSKECEMADCKETVFRGNSLASKVMAYCFKMYGQQYLHDLLKPLIMNIPDRSYEVDPQRYNVVLALRI